MSENTTTLKSGLNLMYPTYLHFCSTDIHDPWLTSALQNEVDESLKYYMYKQFDDFLYNMMGGRIAEWSNYKIDGWINRYENTEMEYHTHSGAHISAVVYLESNPKSGGEIGFYDPRPNVSRGYDMRFRKNFNPTYHAPKTGDVLIFPSYLYHSVKAATHTRISCALDLFLYADN